jgi:hypothetical protein
MSDLDVTERRLDALGVAPVNDDERRMARLTVCEVMTRSGSSAEQIRDVLAALGLDARQVRRPVRQRRGRAAASGTGSRSSPAPW